MGFTAGQRRRRGGRLQRWGGGGIGWGVVVTTVVAVLWWWSAGAADPLAPGDPRAPGPAFVDPADGGWVGDGDAAAGRATPGGSVGPRDSPLEVVRAGARATASVATARFTLSVQLADRSPAVTLTEVTGVVDVVGGRVGMTVREWDPEVGGPPTVLDAVIDGELLYVRSPLLDDPSGTPVWWRMWIGPDASGQPAPGVGPAAVSGLVELVARGRAAELLPAAPGDAPSQRRYRVLLDEDEPSAGGGRPEAVTGWAVVGIDDEGWLRDLEVAATGAWGVAAGTAVVVRVAFGDLGEPVDLALPEPSTVRDAARRGVGAGG